MSTAKYKKRKEGRREGRKEGRVRRREGRMEAGRKILSLTFQELIRRICPPPQLIGLKQWSIRQ